MNFEQYYNQYYGFLRRNFWNYVTVVGGTGGTNYVTWATVTLKVPVANIGYYKTKDSAVSVRTPDGKLPASTTEFYFREIPMVFNNQSDAYFQSILEGKPISLKTKGDIVLQLNIWTAEEGWMPVYIVYDPANMDIQAHAAVLTDMDAAVASIEPLQVKLKQTVARLQENHNTALNALASGQYDADAVDVQKKVLNEASQSILALRGTDAYLIKISPDCGSPADVTSIFGGKIIINAAIAFTAIPVIAAIPAVPQAMSAQLGVDKIVSSLNLNQLKQAIVNSTNGSTSGNILTATPTAEDGPANKKSNAIWWILGIGAAVYALSNTSSNGTAKR